MNDHLLAVVSGAAGPARWLSPCGRTGGDGSGGDGAARASRAISAVGLCLTAPDTGAEAGQNRDPIVVSTCRSAPNQVWIPLQWEVKG